LCCVVPIVRHSSLLPDETTQHNTTQHNTDCHISYYMMPMSMLGLALPWAMLSQLVGTSRRVFQV